MRNNRKLVSLLVLFILIAQVFFSWSYSFSSNGSSGIIVDNSNSTQVINNADKKESLTTSTPVPTQEATQMPTVAPIVLPTQTKIAASQNSSIIIPANTPITSEITIKPSVNTPTNSILPSSAPLTNDKNNNSEKSNGKNKSKRIIVKFKNLNSVSGIKNSVLKDSKLSRLDLKKEIKTNKIQVYELNETEFNDNVLKEFKNNKDVEYAQEDKQLSLYDVPSDTRFSEQWALNNSGQTINGQTGVAGVDINILKAWEKTKGSPDVVVGVMDTGVDINHEDLKDNIYTNTKEIPGNGIDDDHNGYIDDVNGWDFANKDQSVFDSSTSDMHGTHVSGIIAAKDNGKGICGIAPNVKIMPLKFIEGNYGFTSDAIEAIEYCKNMGINVVNCSWGGAENNQALYDEMANSQILYICAAGNMSSDVGQSPAYPACFNIPNVISVAAINNIGNIATYSNYGNDVDVAAPGSDILSTLPGNNYGMLSGTSMAAPAVTGTIALIKSLYPGISINDIVTRIKTTVVKKNNLIGKVNSQGRVDAAAAVNDTTPQPEPTATPTVAPSPIIFSNDENYNIADITKWSVDNSQEKNGKTVKPYIAEENLPTLPQKEIDIPSNNGLDGVKENMQSQSISPYTYVDETEPNNSSSTAMPIGFCSVSGSILNSNDLDDWYAIDLEAGKQYLIRLAGIPTGNDFDLYVYNPTPALTASSTYGSNSDENITLNTTVAGKYYINVHSYTFNSTGSHSYQLLVYPNTNTPDSYEPNDSGITAKSITDNTPINATINVLADTDWYVIDAPKAGKITVTLKNIPTGCDYDLSVFNSNSFDDSIGGSYNGGNQSEKANILIPTPGKYYIKVYPFSGYNASSNYELKAVISTPDNYENNDYIYETKNINMYDSILATIDNQDDEDWFKFSISESATYRFELQNIPTGRDYNLAIYDTS
ncbi:MAG: S8 family serine peptidase, partial [Bacillota bacterium]|nr:S8 family serine peptidase [Bacillota bacterium]